VKQLLEKKPYEIDQVKDRDLLLYLLNVHSSSSLTAFEDFKEHLERRILGYGFVHINNLMKVLEKINHKSKKELLQRIDNRIVDILKSSDINEENILQWAHIIRSLQKNNIVSHSSFK